MHAPLLGADDLNSGVGVDLDSLCCKYSDDVTQGKILDNDGIHSFNVAIGMYNRMRSGDDKTLKDDDALAIRDDGVLQKDRSKNQRPKEDGTRIREGSIGTGENKGGEGEKEGKHRMKGKAEGHRPQCQCTITKRNER